MSRVLVIEDDEALARGLCDNLRDEGHEVAHCQRGDEAAGEIERFDPELVVLDLMLPGRSGLDLLRELRRKGDERPVLVLSAKGEVVDRVVGLELGADDYLPKPFAVRELLARVGVLLRRAGRRANGGPVVVGPLTVDFQAMTAVGTEEADVLTVHDLAVLRVLVERRGEAVARADVVEEVCGLDSEATLRTVDNHVVALRRALGDDPRRPRWLHSVRGIGYRLAREDES